MILRDSRSLMSHPPPILPTVLTNDNSKRADVFDIGGVIFDVSILTIEIGIFEVLATAEDTYLGGKDLDQRFSIHFERAFIKKQRIDLKTDARAMYKGDVLAMILARDR